MVLTDFHQRTRFLIDKRGSYQWIGLARRFLVERKTFASIPIKEAPLREIELSCMVPFGCLELPVFEDKTRIKVRFKQFEWATGWNNVLQIGLYQKGPDLSEVGSTWMENLSDMRSLRPFNEAEIRSLGGREAFLQNAWPEHTAANNTQRLNSIPWTMDTRLICYRRDLLAQAGIEEKFAFSTPEAVFDTLSRLQASGIQYPLALPTGGLSIHNMASWVWERGGNFRSEDFRRIHLVEPEARRGMIDYFRLHPFVDPSSRGDDYHETDLRFQSGQAAVLFSGQWAMRMNKSGDPQIAPIVAETAGYAIPRIPWVGSAHLVIWRHSLHEQELFQLIAHLTSTEIMSNIFATGGNFPTRLETLKMPPFSTDPDYCVVAEYLQRGRAFRSAHLWAGVEMRLNALHDTLWADLFANPHLSLESEIERRVSDIAARLEKTLLANW
jgi:multiple sugar transport system substrate-binding protein